MTKTNDKKKSVSLGALASLGEINPTDGFDIGDNFSSLINGAGAIVTGMPIQLNVDDIIEDQLQIRIKFKDSDMEDLRTSMKTRLEEGKPPLILPISLKKHPLYPGKWLINDGARRYRCARSLKIKKIDAVIDEGFDSFDQATANLQRAGNTAYELAVFCKNEVEKGHKPAYIAKRLGKDNAWVTKHLAIIDMPESLMLAYEKEAIGSVDAIYALITNYKKYHSEIDNLCANAKPGELTRSFVMALVASWSNAVANTKANPEQQIKREPNATSESTSNQEHKPGTGPDAEPNLTKEEPGQPDPKPDYKPAVLIEGGESSPGKEDTSITAASETNTQAAPKQEKPVEKRFKCNVYVSHNGKTGSLLLSIRPEPGKVWVRFDDDSDPTQVPFHTLKIEEILEI